MTEELRTLEGRLTRGMAMLQAHPDNTGTGEPGEEYSRLYSHFERLLSRYTVMADSLMVNQETAQ